MLVNAREWRNNRSQVALPTLLPVTKVRSNAKEAERSLAFKTRWRMFFRLSCKSFTIICFHANFFTFSFVDRQNTYSCKSDLFANFRAVYIFHALWYSLVFTSVSSSRRCWSLNLVRMCLFVLSIFTPPFFVGFFFFFFFHLAFPWVFPPVFGWEWW